MRMVLVMFCVLCSLFSTAVSAQGGEPDLPTYTGWMREALAAAQRSDRLGLEQAAERLKAATSVRLPDGTSVAVDNGWLDEALREAEPDLPAVAERLGAVLDALAQPSGAAPPDSLERLRQILDRPPFKQPEPDPNRWRWMDAFAEWLGRVLDGIFRPVSSVSPAVGEGISWIIAAFGMLLLLGVISYVLIGLRRGVVAETRLDADEREARLSARAALDQAGETARGGDYRTATRYLYLSALLWLDERGLLRYDRALTNREYLERLQHNPALRESLAPIVETFDRVWYGHTPLDAAGFAAYREQVEALRRDRETRRTATQENA